MNGAIGWFARNRVAANLLMAVILGTGFIVFQAGIKLEVFPEFSLDVVSVTVPYRGASPEEVEEAVNIRIEEAIQGLDGIKKLTSVANEGFGVITAQLELGEDADEVLDEIKNRVDAIDTFPAETEKPIFEEVTNRRQVIDVAVLGDADEKTLRAVAERIRDDLSGLEGMSVVELSNARPYEIAIELSERNLRRYGLTFDQVAAAIRRSSLDLPAGSLRTAGGEILLRTEGQAYRQREFEEIVVVTRPDGSELTVGDIARVRDDFEETDQLTRFNGKPAIIVEAFRSGEQSALKVEGLVIDYVEQARSRMPAGIELETWQNAAKILRDRIDLLARTGLQGFALVVLILALFLRFRLAGWVSLGIPISFMGAVALMPALDVSINLISLFAFIVVLGIVVDDAIVAGENIYTTQRRTGRGLQGAIDGAKEVALPVTFAVLTTIVAFLPLVFVEGTIGKVMRVIPLIVVPTLVFSLVESLWILPAHLSHYRPNHRPAGRFSWRRVQGAVAGSLRWLVERSYRPSLRWAVEWRYLTLSLGLFALLVTGGLVAGGRIGFVFFPPVESEYVSVAVTMPQGTPVETTEAAVAGLEGAAEELREEIEGEIGQPIFRHVVTAVGEQPYRRVQAQNGPGGVRERFSGAHLAEVTIELVPAEERELSSEEVAKRWRERSGAIPGAEEIAFTASLFSPGADVDVQFRGPDLAQLQSAVAELKAEMGRIGGVYEIADSFREGKEEIELDIRPAAEIHGLRLADVARQVRQAFYGEEVQRIQRGRDDIRVMLRFPEEERRSLSDLDAMRIRSDAGLEIPFSVVAEAETGRGYAAIKRVNRQRAINVTASIDTAKTKVAQVLEELETNLLPAIVAARPGLSYSFEGQQAEQRDSLLGLRRGFTLAALMIFTLLAIPLRSYVQPLIIMSAIPFGLVGAAWGHVVMGLDLTILSMFGIVALTGVVVNDSLVMVHFINEARKRGGTLKDAVLEAGAARFRPIVLTSLTTFGGLTPLLLERSLQAQFLIPMAVSLAFGVLFATAITLIIVPSGYMVMEDLRGVGRWIADLYRRPRPEAVSETEDEPYEAESAQ